jgi:hypothetical protein
MDLQHAWNAPLPEDPTLKSILSSARLQGTGPRDPLATLRKSLAINFAWSIVMGIALLALLFSTPSLTVRVCLAVPVLFCVWSAWDTWKLRASIPAGISGEYAVLPELKRHYEALRRWVQVGQRAGLLVYPFSAAGGFVLGGLAGSGGTVAELMAMRGMFWLLGISLVILTPLCWLGARWMYRLAFGAQEEALRKRINELEGA